MEINHDNKVVGSCLIDYTKCKAALPLEGDLPPTRCHPKHENSQQARLQKHKNTAHCNRPQVDPFQESRRRRLESKADPIVFTLKRSRAVEEPSEHLDEDGTCQLLKDRAEQDSLQEYALNFPDEAIESPESFTRIKKDNLRQKSPNSVVLAKSLGIESNILSPRRKSRTVASSSATNDRILKLRKLTHLEHLDNDADEGKVSEPTRSPSRRVRESDAGDRESSSRFGPQSRGHERNHLNETAATQLFVASNRLARRKSLEMSPLQTGQAGASYHGASQIGLNAGPHAGDQLLIEMHQELRRASLHEELRRKQGSRPRAQSRTKSDRESLLALQATLRRTTISHRECKEKENQYRRTKSLQCSSPLTKPSGAIRAKSIPTSLRTSCNAITSSPRRKSAQSLSSQHGSSPNELIRHQRAVDFCDISSSDVFQSEKQILEQAKPNEIILSDWNPPEEHSNQVSQSRATNDLKHRVFKQNPDPQETTPEKSKSYAYSSAPIRRGKNIQMILRKLASNGLLDKNDKKPEVLAC